VSQLVSTFASKDTELASIVDNLDKFTATLTTRETQLGDILSTFSQATQVLADERQSLENLLAGLANLSKSGLELVSKHSAQLRTDLDTLTRLAQSIDVNIEGLTKLLDTGPLLVKGIIGANGNGTGAYNPDLRAVNLRQNFGPVAEELLQSTFGPGFPIPVPCVPTPVTPCTAALQPLAASTPVRFDAAGPTTPIDDLLALFASPTVSAPAAPTARDRIADGTSSFGGFLRDCASGLVGSS
jgi:ABC-type transporter Mla subunit MlaD